MAFEQAAQLSPEDWEAHLGLAQAYGKLGQKVKALAALRRTLSLDPNNAEAEERLRALMQDGSIE